MARTCLSGSGRCTQTRNSSGGRHGAGRCRGRLEKQSFALLATAGGRHAFSHDAWASAVCVVHLCSAGDSWVQGCRTTGRCWVMLAAPLNRGSVRSVLSRHLALARAGCHCSAAAAGTLALCGSERADQLIVSRVDPIFDDARAGLLSHTEGWGRASKQGMQPERGLDDKHMPCPKEPQVWQLQHRAPTGLPTTPRLVGRAPRRASPAPSWFRRSPYCYCSPHGLVSRSLR